MVRALYYVLQDLNQWKIRHDGEDYSFDTRTSAIRAAIEAAQKAGEQGYDAEVLVHDRNGRWQTEWAYGKQGPAFKS